MIQWQLYSSSGVVIDLFAYFADSSLNTILLICFLTEKYPDFFFQAQENCLESIGEHATTTPAFMPIVVKIIHHLYDEDILSEDAILDWSVIRVFIK